MKNAVLTGRPNFPCSVTGNDPKKGPQNMPKRFQNIFSEKFPWSLKDSLTFFGQPAESFPLDIQKNNNL